MIRRVTQQKHKRMLWFHYWLSPKLPNTANLRIGLLGSATHLFHKYNRGKLATCLTRDLSFSTKLSCQSARLNGGDQSAVLHNVHFNHFGWILFDSLMLFPLFWIFRDICCHLSHHGQFHCQQTNSQYFGASKFPRASISA